MFSQPLREINESVKSNVLKWISSKIHSHHKEPAGLHCHSQLAFLTRQKKGRSTKATEKEGGLIRPPCSIKGDSAGSEAHPSPGEGSARTCPRVLRLSALDDAHCQPSRTARSRISQRRPSGDLASPLVCLPKGRADSVLHFST